MHSVLGSDVPLSVCKMCFIPKYCSVTCQADDWRQGHSKICGAKLKVEARKGHWALRYAMRADELSISHMSFPSSPDAASTRRSVCVDNERFLYKSPREESSVDYEGSLDGEPERATALSPLRGQLF